ncbi:pyridine nucleotide-disulfide oxidoreductase-domain-containing protein [Phycomyces nitens]|nr:pyridine nucleotide-disulfide oxidoreductase-domain-containing protein [Phycomyces nitens]
MRELNKEDYNVSVVSPRNYFVFTPLLASTSVGTLEFRCITEPVRGYSKDIDFMQARCDKIDIGTKFTLDYDKLVIGVGSYSNTFGIPGVKEYGHFLKDVNDARRIRKRVIECFEYASQSGLTSKQKEDRLHFVVVGGGPTGIEFSAELYDFIASDMSRLYPDLMSKTRMTLYDVAPHILGSFDTNLSDYAQKKFSRKGIQIKTQRHVEKVEQDHLIIRDEGNVPYGLLVWSTGLMQNPLVKSLENVAMDAKKQRILTDSKLRVIDESTQEPYPNVYALGDCATIKDNDLPATAQVFNKMVVHGSGMEANCFEFKNRGMMAYIGSSEALVDMSSVHQLAKKSGHLPWLLWRSAYFSMSMSLRNRMLIPYHWFLTWCFGRDISRF